jgi:mono/diheme cytochrome c family protein
MRASRLSKALIGWLGASLLWVAYVQAAGPPPTQTRGLSDQAAVPTERLVLNRYCVTCHNERLRTAGLALDTKDVGDPALHGDVWEKVVRKLRGGAMPPPGSPRPDPATLKAFIASLETSLDRSAAAKPDPGRPSVHRLNRAEYTNAIRDLLALEVDPQSILFADDADQHGFDNNADVLSISPVLMDRYLSAARQIARQALGRVTAAATAHVYEVPRMLFQDGRMSEDLPFGSRGGIAIRHHFPVDGEYTVKIKLQTNLYDYIRGLGSPHQLQVRLDGAPVRTFTIGGRDLGKPAPASFAGAIFGTPEWERYTHDADADLEARFAVRAGTRTVGISFVGELPAAPEGVPQPRQVGYPLAINEMSDGNPSLENVAITGPFNSAGAGDTPSRRRILTCRPPQSDTTNQLCARDILSTLARRAFRRPVSERDLRTLLTFYRAGRDQGGPDGFEAGIQRTLERILVDPEFLFRIERDPEDAAPGTPYRVSELELASRLSFFLWSSIPDDELLEAAVRGKLKEPAALERQVRRLFADARAKDALVDNFAGQWLELRNVRNWAPDPDLFRDFDENLREAMRRETELFLRTQLDEDRSVVGLLSANYTFVNERLARHYGIPNVFGERFRRVTFNSGDPRGGLLGQAGVLMVTSYPNRTSPVLRGKWLLTSVLGTPPPPPPPDVPALKDKNDKGQPVSVRARLEAHRASPACASCHAQMDPLGFALENFDATGRWRAAAEGGEPVDASAALSDGTTFEGPAGLRQLLLARRDQFVSTVTEKLLAYALGRGLEWYDYPVVRKITREAAASDYRWSSIILGIAKSTPFQMRRSES